MTIGRSGWTARLTLTATLLVLMTGCGVAETLSGPAPAASTQDGAAAAEAIADEDKPSRKAWRRYQLHHGVKMRLPRGTAETLCESRDCKKAKNWVYDLPTQKFVTSVWVMNDAKCHRRPGQEAVPFLREGIEGLAKSYITARGFQGLPGVVYAIGAKRTAEVIVGRKVLAGNVEVAVQFRGSNTHVTEMKQLLRRLFAGLEISPSVAQEPVEVVAC